MEPIRQLVHEYRVRFDEADADGRLRPSGLLRYAQDMAWRHSEEAGFARDWYAGRGMNWLVRNVQAWVKGPITYGDRLAVSTQVVGWRHVWARRQSEIRRNDSEGRVTESALVATVDTDWVLLTDEGRPARVPADVAAYFGPVVPFARERVTLPKPTGPVTTLSTRVRPLDVDPMRHMNSAAYLDMVDDGLARMPEATGFGAPDCYHVGYVAPALPCALLDIRCWSVSSSQIACRISDGDGVELARALARRSG